MTTVSSLCRSTIPLFSIIFCARDQLDCPITSPGSPQIVVRSRPWQRMNNFCHSNTHSSGSLRNTASISLMIFSQNALLSSVSAASEAIIVSRNGPGSTPYKLCARFPGSKAPTALRPTLKTQAKTDTTHERPEQHRTLPNNGQHRKNCDPHVLFWSILINESDPREKRQERERTGKWTFWQLLESAVLCLIAKFGK